MDRTERFYKIKHLLSMRRFVTLAEFVAELEVSKSTIKRDLEYLRERHQTPILYDRAQSGYFLDTQDSERHELPGLWFSAQEAYALLTFYHLLERLQPNLLDGHIAPLKARFELLLEDKGRHNVEEIRARIRVLPLAARPVTPRCFEILAQATLSRRRLSMCYYSRERDEETAREISPQRLIHYRDNWYLDAWDHSKNKLRTFSLDCIRQATLLDTKARNITEKALDAELGSGYGIFAGRRPKTAKLRFTPKRARWVANEQWHPKQKAYYQDAHYILEVPYTDDRELLMDILKYGGDVEVLGPAVLRTQVASMLQKTLKNYNH